ncbi:hypothetical protein P7D31_00410 [Enterococcus dongliensis]|uniref:hypothetical protein n=1 Tax=Enterococcus dongliensis TaxID=2559925 RepID=UPI00288CB1F8|nr:hypothetical protein [Enterococcus dongliensis]MDT2613233.1 hypothetical protein [Enterococcus dongliensis]MDT2638576.1 hypothetical protein [Enterococcus dongliensis]
MNTAKKWLIFWGVLAALFVGFFGIVLSGNFPQFAIPFSVFASDDKAKKKEELPKLKILALRDVNDQELLKQQMEKVEALNQAFKDSANFSSSQAMADTIEKIYGSAKEGKNSFDLYRKIYPMVSSEENGFVSVNLIGFGQRLVNDQPMTVQRQVWSFTDTNGRRHDYTVRLRFNEQELAELTAEEGSEVKSVITTDDTYLDKSADFETAWSEVVRRGTDTQLYREMKKAGLNSDQTEFKALEKSIELTDPSGFFDLFKETRGDLTHAYLAGFYHTNTPTDGQSDYYFRVPTSEKNIAEFLVVYDRLQQKIVSINRN